MRRRGQHDGTWFARWLDELTGAESSAERRRLAERLRAGKTAVVQGWMLPAEALARHYSRTDTLRLHPDGTLERWSPPTTPAE